MKTPWTAVIAIWAIVGATVVGCAWAWGPDHAGTVVVLAIGDFFMALVTSLFVAYGASQDASQRKGN